MRYLIVLFCFVFFPSLAQEREFERIVHYHSDIQVQKNRDVLITETIKVYAGGQEIRRGIFRELPLSYEYKGGNWKVRFELLEVLRDGKVEPYHTENMSNGIRIYAGEKETFLDNGFYTYTLKYRVHHVLGLFDDFDEIYWNINGNGWQFQIDSLSATIHWPKGASMKRFDGYTGVFGARGKDFNIDLDSTKITFEVTRVMQSGENLTVAVAWDKGHLEYPTDWDEFVYRCQTYALFITASFGLMIGFLYNYRNWHKYGRDPKKGTIIPRFYAPEGFSPAECVYLKREGRESDQMFGAQLVSLAVKGFVTIKVNEKKGVFGEASYTITKNDSSEHKDVLNDTEESFMRNLIGSQQQIILTKKYNPRVKAAWDQLISSIEHKQEGKYIVRNGALKAKQFIIPVVFMITGFIMHGLYGGPMYIVFIGLFLHIVMNIIFFRLYEQPTAEGRRLMDEIAGFEMYMKYADKLRIKAINPPSMDFDYFEKNLAYAIALGVADEWKNQFDVKMLEEAKVTRMPYLTGISIASMSNFSKSMSSTISSASTPPSSSGSGSGGGGSSGGGGGGGGGGGW